MMKRRLAILILPFILLSLLLPVMPVAAATVLSDVMPDANLRQAVANRLGVQYGDVELGRMQDILNLDASGLNVKDITGLEFCINMVRLDVSNNQIEDISTLAKLYSAAAGTKLREVNLANNNISDVSPLRDLTQLERLNLSGNLISNLSPFAREAGSYAITMLNLNENQISDVSSLARMTQISVLHLANNQISDITSMTSFVGLGIGDALNLYDNPLSDTAVNDTIAALRAKRVSVYWGHVSPPAVVTGPVAPEVPQVDIVIMEGPLDTAIRDLLSRPQGDILAYEPKILTALDLSNRGLSDLSGLENFSTLRFLDLSGNAVTDISILLKLDMLEMLLLNGNPLNEASVKDYIPQLEARAVNVTFQEPPAPDAAPAPAPEPTPAPTPVPVPVPAPQPDPEPPSGMALTPMNWLWIAVGILGMVITIGLSMLLPIRRRG